MWETILSMSKPAEKAVLIKRQKEPETGRRTYTVRGATGTIKMLAKLFNVPYATVRYRMAKGLSLEEALTVFDLRKDRQKTEAPVFTKPKRKTEFVRVGSGAGYYTWRQES